MRKQMRLMVIITVGGLIQLWSCAKEVSFQINPTGSIDEALLPYYEVFVAEAAARHLDISAETYAVNASFSTLTSQDGQRVIGMCTARAGDHTVTLDKSYWTRATPLLKEFLIFHELGHCVLEREHLDTKESNGTCTSIMHSGTTGCRNAYATSTRSAYLDELFGGN